MNTTSTSNPGASAAQQTTPRSVDARILANMIQRVHDPVVARIFLSTLETYPELQVQFLGAFLKAHETVKRSQIRYAKARDLGHSVAWFAKNAVGCSRFVVRGCTRLVGSLQKSSLQTS